MVLIVMMIRAIKMMIAFTIVRFRLIGSSISKYINDVRTVYQTGPHVVLIEALTGFHPFPCGTPAVGKRKSAHCSSIHRIQSRQCVFSTAPSHVIFNLTPPPPLHSALHQRQRRWPAAIQGDHV